MKKQQTTSLIGFINSAPVKAGLKLLVAVQAIAPIIQMLAAVKTLFS